MSQIYNQVIELNGALPGPTVTILAGVHGNELPGIKAMLELLGNLPKITRGRLFLLFGNPRAIEANVRQTEQNLNRLFLDDLPANIQSSYEYQRAQMIKKYLNQSDICLDLHASSTPGSPIFAITEEPAFELTSQLPVSSIVSNIDPFEPGSTDGYMNNRGKWGICVECGYLADMGAAELATETIWSLLRGLSMITEGNLVRAGGIKQTQFRVTDIYKNKQTNFTLQRDFNDFERVEAGELIGRDGETEIAFERPFHVLFAVNRSAPGEECFLKLELR